MLWNGGDKKGERSQANRNKIFLIYKENGYDHVYAITYQHIYVNAYIVKLNNPQTIITTVIVTVQQCFSTYINKRPIFILNLS